MDRNVCAFDQPDVKEKNIRFFFFLGVNYIRQCRTCFWSVHHYSEYERDERKSTTTNSSRFLFQVSVVGRHVAGQVNKKETGQKPSHISLSFMIFSSFPKSSWTSFIHKIVQQPSLVSGPIHLQLGRTVGSVRRSRRDPTSKAFYLYSSSFSKKQVSHLVLYHVSKVSTAQLGCRIGANTNTQDSFSLESTETTRLGLKTHWVNNSLKFGTRSRRHFKMEKSNQSTK